MLAIGLEGGLQHFDVELGAPRCSCGSLRRLTTRRSYPAARRAIPFALAALRGRRRGSMGTYRQDDVPGAMQPSARGRPSTSPSSAFCSTPAPDPRWRYRDATTGASCGRSEGLALASLAMFADGRLLVRMRAGRLRADAATLDSTERQRPWADTFRSPPPTPAGTVRADCGCCSRLGATVAARTRTCSRAPTSRDPEACSTIWPGLVSGGVDCRACAILAEILRQLGLDLASRGCSWRRPPRRLLAPPGPGHGRRTIRARAAAQAFAVAGLFADRAAAGSGHRRDGHRWPDRACRISQRRAAHRHGRPDPARPGRDQDCAPGRCHTRRRMARAHRGAARPAGGDGAPASRPGCGVRCRSPEVLQGGTWAAGRADRALLRRTDGAPPLKVVSDGTVF